MKNCLNSHGQQYLYALNDLLSENTVGKNQLPGCDIKSKRKSMNIRHLRKSISFKARKHYLHQNHIEMMQNLTWTRGIFLYIINRFFFTQDDFF